MRTKILVPLILICVTSGHVAADDSHANKAYEDIMVCQYKAAIELDDGISGVESIVPAVANSCQNETNRFYHALRSSINGPIDEAAVQRATREKALQTANSIILMKRADERKARGQQ